MAQAFNLTARINLQGPFNLRPIVSKIKKDIGGIKPELKFKLDPSAAKSVKAVTAEIKKLDSAAKSAKKSVGSLNSSLQTLSASFNTAAASSKNASNAAANVGRATAAAAKSTNQARTAVEEFGKQSGLAIKRFAAFTSVTSLVFGLTNAISSAYKEFLLFNKEIVRLAQVTDKSVSDLKGVSDEITRLSTSIGVASSDLISVASTLAQAGLSAEDTKIALEALAKSALAPSFENITDTTEGAIAAIRQFGLETRELESALGSINSVAAAFAVEAGDIIAAIQRTGGVFASASRGVSQGTDALNEFIAIFTSIRQTTRESAETIATGLRTIFTRIQRSDTIDLLKQYGIELRDLEGKFVGPFEATKRLSEGLSQIDPRSADFARISEELGGFRQIGKVIPLIQQFAVAQDALNVAQKGSGSLTKDVQTAQQSLAVQFAKTRENFLALIREIGESQSFKVFVGSTLTLTNALIDLGQALKPILPLLLTFGAIKAGSSINQFFSGFGLAFGRGGGGGPSGPTTGPSTGPSGGGGGGNQPLTSALTLSTAATNSLTQTIGVLNNNVTTLNSLLSARQQRPTGFASGGLVPGSGNRDTVSAKLTPGEFVIRKRAVEAIGVENLAKMNSGGFVRKYEQGSGSPGGVETPTEKEQIDKILQDIFESNFQGTYIRGPSGNVTVSALKKPQLPKQTGGLPVDKLQLAQKKINEVLTTTSAVKLQNKQEFDKKRQDLIDSGKILKFGLAGLRFGTTAQGKWSGEIPPSFVGVEGVRETEKGIPVQIFAGALSNSDKITNQEAQQLEQAIIKDFSGSVQKIAQNLGSRVKASVISDQSEIAKRLENSGLSNVIGAGLESAISLLGAPYVAKDEKTKSIDFPSGLGAGADLFGIRGDIPTDVTRTIGSPGKGITDYLKQIGRFLDSPLASFAKFATGGSVEDTVPALLTPGEFVFNKDSAKRIGYGNLNRMNKVKGFNKGGVVGPQRFALGGAVSDPTLVAAALASVLLPQVEKLAQTFGKLEGSVGSFGTALGGAIREASSIVLSAGIGLQAVGASRRTTLLAQGIGGTAAAIGGGLTDTTGKLLEKALLANTSKIGEFNKSLQDYTNAPTEELRIEAAKKVEQNFLALDTAIRASKESIDGLENLKNFGQSINNATLSVLSTITAMSALASATTRQSAIVNTRGVSSSLRLIGTVGTIAGLLGRFAGPIGAIISIVSVGIEAFSFFNSKLKSSDEQFNSLNEALRETIKVSNDYNLANENFINNILPQYRNLTEQRPGQSTDIAREIGSLTENSLNLTRNFMIKQFAAQGGLPIGTTEDLKAVQKRISGQSNLENILTSSIEKANQRYIKEGFAAAMKERGLTNPQDILKQAQDLGGFDSKAVQQIAQDYFGELDRRLLAERSLAAATRDLKVNMVNLSNITSNLESIFSRSLSGLETSFKDLNRNIDILLGEQIKAEATTVLEKNIQILDNLKQSTPREIASALQPLRRTLGPADSTAQSVAFGQIVDAVQSAAVLQQRGDFVLNKISQLGLQGEGTREILNQELKDILIKSLGGGPGAETTATTLINELAAAIQAGGVEGKPITSIDEAASRIEGFGTLLGELNNVTKTASSTLKSLDAAEKAVVESINKELEIRSKFTDLSVQRQQTEIRNNIALKKALGQRVSLEDINEEFLTEIRSRTSDVPGLDIRAGQVTASQVNAIAAELNKAKAEIAKREQTANQTGNRALVLDLGFKALLDKANNLQKVMDLLANSGILVSNAFEEISKRRDLFKSREELLFQLLRDSADPAKAFELTEIAAAIKAVQNNVADQRQALIAAEKGAVIVGQAQGPEAGEKFLSQARKAFAEAIEPRTLEQAVAKALVLAQMTLEEQAIPQPAKDAINAQAAAQEQLLKPVEQALLESITNTGKIFDNFNNNISRSFFGLLQTLDAIQNRVQERVRIQATPQIPSDILNKISEAVSRLSSTRTEQRISRTELLNRYGDLGEDSPDFLRDVARGRVSRTPALPIPAIATEARAAEAIQLINSGDISKARKALEQFRADIVEFGSGQWEIFGGLNRREREERVNLVLTPLIQRLLDLEAKQKQLGPGVFEDYRFVPNTQPTPTVPNRPVRDQLNMGPAFNQGSFLDPASKRTLDGLTTTTKDLASALTGENNTISQLFIAVNNLAPVTKGLQDTVNQLSALVKEGVQLKQTASADINVTFENGIPLETEAGLDNKIADNIRGILETTLGSKFNKFARDLFTSSSG